MEKAELSRATPSGSQPPGPVIPSFLAPFAGEHDVNCLENNHGVQLERVMSYIIKVVLQLLYRVFFALAVRIIDLCPTGNPRLDQMPKMVKRNLFLITFSDFNPFRPWAD